MRGFPPPGETFYACSVLNAMLNLEGLGRKPGPHAISMNHPFEQARDEFGPVGYEEFRRRLDGLMVEMEGQDDA